MLPLSVLSLQVVGRLKKGVMLNIKIRLESKGEMTKMRRRCKISVENIVAKCFGVL